MNNSGYDGEYQLTADYSTDMLDKMIATMDPATEPMKSLLAAHPVGRIAQAAEIADAVVWLCSDKAGFITGVALPIDGGYTVP